MKKFNPLKNIKKADRDAENDFLNRYHKLTMETGYRLKAMHMITDQDRSVSKAVQVPVKFDKDKLLEEQLKLNNNKKDVSKDK